MAAVIEKPTRSKAAKAPSWHAAYPDITKATPERRDAYLEAWAALGSQMTKEVTERMDRGWLRPFLFTYDALLTGRWDYWLEITQKGTIEGAGPIPQTEFADSPWDGNGHHVKRMLDKCMDHPKLQSHSVDKRLFIDWLLWGFGDPLVDDRPQIHPDVERHWYETFDLMVMLVRPCDYMSMFALEHLNQSGVLEFFPTPMHLSVLMARMLNADDQGVGEDNCGVYPANSTMVFDPCVGCGSLLLPVSNYSLRLFALDLNSLMVKLTKVQMWFYAPWGATGSYGVDFGPGEKYPGYVGQHIRQGNSLVEICYAIDTKFDRVVANPPFGDKTKMSELEREIDAYLREQIGIDRKTLTQTLAVPEDTPLAGAEIKAPDARQPVKDRRPKKYRNLDDSFLDLGLDSMQLTRSTNEDPEE